MVDPLDNEGWIDDALAGLDDDEVVEVPEEPKSATQKKTVSKNTAVSKATGKKKKTKKKTKKQERDDHWSLDNLNRATGMALGGILAETSTEAKKIRVATLEDSSGFTIGIPCPSFAMEYLIQNTCVPLEKTIQIYGPRGIGKSGLAFELMRIWRKYHGIGHLLENESKFNAAWARSIIGWWDAQCLGVVPCTSINDWQTELQRAVKKIKGIMLGDSKTMGSGKIFPWLGIVDSIMGKPFQETIDKVNDQGFAGRGHPIEAMSITTFVKAFASQMDEWPFALVCINHEKTKKNESGPDEKNRSGGQTIDFQGSFELQVKRIGRIRTATINGNKLIIKCEKNAYGEDARSIPLDCIWYDEEKKNPYTGEMEVHQTTTWNWDGSTIKLLTSDRSKGESWNSARKLCGGVVKVNEGKYYATGLGVPKTAATNPHTLGAKIRGNLKMMQGLRDIFGVRTMREFRNDTDYEDQILEVKRAMASMETR